MRRATQGACMCYFRTPPVRFCFVLLCSVLVLRVRVNPDRHEAYDKVKCFQDLILEDGQTWRCMYASPSLTLQLTLSMCERFQAVYASALIAHPCSAERPWHVVMGFDEFAPGSQLQVDNARKCMNLYFNFLELGQRCLQQDCTWMVVCAARHELMVRVVGGWSRMLGLLLEHAFLRRDGFSHGVVVVIAGKQHRIFAKLANLLSDGDGLRLAYCWKGASGLKPCLNHWNVLKKQSDALTSRAPGYVEISCGDFTKFKKRNVSDFVRSYAKVAAAHTALAAKRMTQTLHDQCCMGEGFNFVQGGMPYMPSLHNAWTDIFNAVTVDWVHTTAQDGMLTVEAFAYLEAANHKCGFKFQHVESHLKDDWCWPKAMRSKFCSLHRVFSEYRLSRGREDPHKIKASASECLGMYVLLRDFIETVIGDRAELDLERQSFDAACYVVDLILRAKNSLISMHDASAELRVAMGDFMAKHTRAYGDALVKPKHHWLWDLVDQFMRDPFVLDALIVERLHLTIRRAAENVHNLSTFEASVLSRALNYQISQLQSMSENCTLEQTSKLAGYADLVIGDNMQILGMRVSVGDAIFHGESAGKILACAREGDSYFVLAHQLEHLGSSSRHKSLWRFTQGRKLVIWPALEIEQAHRVESWKGLDPKPLFQNPLALRLRTQPAHFS